jgi:hypothetical protein
MEGRRAVVVACLLLHAQYMVFWHDHHTHALDEWQDCARVLDDRIHCIPPLSPRRWVMAAASFRFLQDLLLVENQSCKTRQGSSCWILKKVLEKSCIKSVLGYRTVEEWRLVRERRVRNDDGNGGCDFCVPFFVSCFCRTELHFRTSKKNALFDMTDCQSHWCENIYNLKNRQIQ